jgi:heme exporter protein A
VFSTTLAGATTSEPTAATSPLLTARHLACRRGDRLLFRELDLDLLPGQILWVRGRNGCGKTSLLRILAGLSPPEHGSVQHSGRPAYLAHSNALKDDLTVLESLQFLARLHGAAASTADCARGLKLVGLHDRRNAVVRTLSQGQRRRVALSRLFMQASARVWILDEPYDALDSDAVLTLDQALQQHAHGGGAAVLTSHLELSLNDPLPATLQLDQIARP